MTISRTNNGALDTQLLQYLQQNQQQNATANKAVSDAPANKTPQRPTHDVVALSGQRPESTNGGSLPFQNNQNNTTRLVNEETQDLENGIRKTQEFETPNGKKFTRIEEITSEDTRSKRVVIQQNESGSTTTLENIIDQQEDGSLRLVQRFTDETGDTQANVKLNYTPTPNDVLVGGAPVSATTATQNNVSRGAQLDLQV